MTSATTEYDLPGPFVVLQGIAGDGMANTIDTMPELIMDDDDEHIDEHIPVDENINQNMDNNMKMEGNDLQENQQIHRLHSNLQLHIPESTSETSSFEEVIHYPLQQQLQQQQKQSQHQQDEDGGGKPAAADTSAVASTSAAGSSVTATNICNQNMTNHGLNLPIPQVASMSMGMGVGVGYNSIIPPLGVPSLPAAAAVPAQGSGSRRANTHANAAMARMASAKKAQDDDAHDSFILVDDEQEEEQEQELVGDNRTNTNDDNDRNSRRRIKHEDAVEVEVEVASNPTPAASSLSSSSSNSPLLSPLPHPIDIGPSTTIHHPRYASLSSTHVQSLQQWHASCRETEAMQRSEVLYGAHAHYMSLRSLPSASSSSDSESVSDSTTSITSNGVSSGNNDDDAGSDSERCWWRSKRGCLLVFDAPPTFNDETATKTNTNSTTSMTIDNLNVNCGNIVGELTPGTTVMGMAMTSFHIPTLARSTNNNNNPNPSPNPNSGKIEILQIDSPLCGYILYSLEGYPLLGPGLPSNYMDPETYLWKVTCVNGAFVRQGLELTSMHVETVPYGSLVMVLRKTVNQMGLSRLQIETVVQDEEEDSSSGDDNDDDNDGEVESAAGREDASSGNATPTSRFIKVPTSILSSLRGVANSSTNIITSTSNTHAAAASSRRRQQDGNPRPKTQKSKGTRRRRRVVSGWISQALNPLSGQSGPIVQQVPFPIPALFRVVLSDGAVIRSGVELSSSQIGHAPEGTVLNIVGRSFTQHPGDCCIQRLKLAGGGGWVSVRLNRRPPRDNTLVLTHVDVDGTFDPEEAGLFHMEKQLWVMHEYLDNIMNVNIHDTHAHTPDDEDVQNMENVRRSLQRLGSSCISSINDDDENENVEGVEGVNDNSGGDAAVASAAANALGDTMTTAATTPASNSTNAVVPATRPHTHIPALYRSGVGNAAGISSAKQRRLKGYCNKTSQHQNEQPEPCLICLTEERNATIVHGETGHIACCLTCARILKARGDKCPVCRLPIDLIIQQFWA
jgi:hypothetical protein